MGTAVVVFRADESTEHRVRRLREVLRRFHAPEVVYHRKGRLPMNWLDATEEDFSAADRAVISGELRQQHQRA